MESTSKLRVILLASEWGSKRSRLSTFNRELAIQLAKCPEVKVSVLVPRCDQEERKAAHNNKVSLIQAKEMTGFEETYWLSFPPDDLQIDFIVGHGVELGRHAQVIRDHRQCKWIQFVHTDPEELGMFKGDSDAISKAERQHKAEVDLCVKADCVVAVGPKVAEAYRSYLTFCEKDQDLFVLTPGIFSEFFNAVRGKQDGSKCRVLAFGRGDSEDFSLKGFDIAAGAVGKLDDAICIFVGAQDRRQDEVADRLKNFGIPPERLKVRTFIEIRERLKQQFSEVDIAILPSRSEGFGLAALEALSAGLPVLVSDNSGFGKALQEVPFGSHYVVSSEDAALWATKIKEIWAKTRETRLQEAEGLRENYGKKYIWEEQCKGLVERMKKVLDACSIWPSNQQNDLRIDSKANEHSNAKNANSMHSESEESLLHSAAVIGDVNTLTTILSLERDIDSRNSDGATPLMIAARHGNLDACNVLIEKGSDPTLTDNSGWTLLHYAALNGHDVIIKKLLSLGLDMYIHSRDSDGVTPLMIAALCGKLDAFNVLLERKSDPTLKNINGWTLLHYAARGGNDVITEKLLSLGLDIDSRNRDGSTPLRLATRHGNYKVVRCLLKRGVRTQLNSKRKRELEC